MSHFPVNSLEIEHIINCVNKRLLLKDAADLGTLRSSKCPGDALHVTEM